MPVPEICTSIETDVLMLVQELVLMDLNNRCVGTDASVKSLGPDPDGRGFLASSQVGATDSEEWWRLRCAVGDDGTLDLRLCYYPNSEDRGLDPPQPAAVDGLGRIRAVKVSIDESLRPHLRHVLGQPFTKTLNRLTYLAVTIAENAYAGLRLLVKKRLSRLSHEFYSDMYGVVGDALSSNSQAASQIVLGVTCLLSTVIYARDPFAIEASIEAASKYRGMPGFSPIEAVARFWDTFARGRACWPVSSESSTANLSFSPYASTNWHRWERIRYGSIFINSMALAQVEDLQIEAWYPSSLAAEIESKLPAIRSKIRAILSGCVARVASELGYLSDVLPEISDGGFIGRPSLAIETIALRSARRGDSPSKEMDAESRGEYAVHLVGTIVNEANQTYRGYTNGDHGIDNEIEFKTHEGRASGKRLYLQIKSGDSHLHTRQRDGAMIFYIQKPWWAEYWREQKHRVMLVICNSAGEVWWMDVSSYLERECSGGKSITHVVFKGERFDVASVLRWRDRLLQES